MERENILEIKDLDVRLFTERGELPVIDRLNLTLRAGETLGIVGESGCGKSMLASAIMGLVARPGKITGGEILFGRDEKQDLTKMSAKELRKIRGTGISMIFQEPMTSLNPLMSCGRQIVETIVAHEKIGRAEAKERAISIIRSVGIQRPEKVYGEVPAQLSGGMRQRIMIAMALVCNPELLICDEPTTALDVTIQAQILDLIRNLQKELNMTVVYITHDLGVVANVADRVAVMYAGQIVEYGMVEEIFYDAWHPYTWALLSALPQLGVKGEALPTIDGTPPNLFNEVKGDAFAPRNKRALAIDFVEEPPFFEVSPTHKAKTWYLDPRAPKIEQPDSIRRLREQMKLKERG